VLEVGRRIRTTAVAARITTKISERYHVRPRGLTATWRVWALVLIGSSFLSGSFDGPSVGSDHGPVGAGRHRSRVMSVSATV
jgi:hypothetical protein